MPSLEQKSGRINELEGLRGLLALWVLTAHILCWCGLLDANIPLHFETIWSLLLSGVPPVEIFIILSGFAITFFLYHQKQTYLQFMKSRFFRIYPVYLVCLLVAIPVSGLLPSIVQTASWQNTVYFQWVQQDYQYQASNTVGHIGAHLTLLNGLIPSQFLPGSATTILPPAWSITLEWQFYLVAPLLLLMLRSGVGLLALIVVSVLANRYGTPWQNSLLAFLPSQLPLFLVGIGSYHLYSKFKTIAAEGTKAPVMAIAILLAAAVLMDSTHAVALGIWVLVFGCLFLRGDDLFSRMLAKVRLVLLHRWFQSLGKISYPLYLIHWPVLLVSLQLLLYVKPTITSPEAILALFMVALPVMFLTATLLHHLVENPGRAFGRWLSTIRPYKKPEAATALEFPAFGQVKSTNA